MRDLILDGIQGSSDLVARKNYAPAISNLTIFINKIIWNFNCDIEALDEERKTCFLVEHSRTFFGALP